MPNLAPLPISAAKEWTNGYLNSSGGITTSGADNGMVSPLIQIVPSESYTVTPAYTVPSTYSGWIAVVQYNTNYAMIGSRLTATSGKSAIPTLTFTANANAKYIKVCSSNLQNDVNASFTVDGVAPVIVYPFHAAEGEYPINDQIMPILQNGFTEPLPTNRWRIDESNGGYPYHMLMPDILYAEPEPPLDPYTPESYDWLGHWFIRKNDMDLARSSVMGYISGKANKSFKPYNFKSQGNWNQSVQNLIKKYYEMIGEDLVEEVSVRGEE